jgi:tripartite-type tricarboxylate transporter receptor subunit TctC
VTTESRSHVLPEVPTVMESGVPGYKYMGWFGMFGPGKLPPQLVSRLSAEVARILALPDVRERMLNLATTPTPSTPEALHELVRTEIQTRRKIFAQGEHASP